MRHARPHIGISTPDNGNILLWWWTKTAIRLAGGIPSRIRPSCPDAMPQCDGFVICGGADINPSHYHQLPASPSYTYDNARDKMELMLVEHAVRHQKPLLGICRGMQMINIACGGSLYQEAADILEDFLPNTSIISKILGRRAVFLEPSSQLYQWMGGYDEYFVNSIHHQAVNEVAEGFQVVAREKNGLIQAIEHNSFPALLGVQWHPELMLHAPSARNLFRCFVNSVT